jgi:hypothetical protein
VKVLLFGVAVLVVVLIVFGYVRSTRFWEVSGCGRSIIGHTMQTRGIPGCEDITIKFVIRGEIVSYPEWLISWREK